MATGADMQQNTVDAADLQSIANQLQELKAAVDKLSEQNRNYAAQLAMLKADSENIRISAKNRRNKRARLEMPFLPLKKTTPGHGLAFAQAASKHFDQDVQRYLVVPPDNEIAIGATPLNFNPDRPFMYKDSDVVRMMIFYNSDFEILPGDNENQRGDKIEDFLCDNN